MKGQNTTIINNKNDSTYIVFRNITYACMLGLLVYHLFPFQPIVWRSVLLLLSIISMGIIFKHYKLETVSKSMLAFGILIVLYFFASYLWTIPQMSQFGNIMCAIFPVFIFFVLTANGAITLRSLTVFLLLSTIASYFYFTHAEGVIIQNAINGESGDYTINASTAFLVIIPLLFFVRNKWIMIGVSVAIVFFIIYGAKRGNLVSAVLPFYLLVRMNMKSNKSLLSELFLAVVVLAVSYFAYYTMTNSDYLMYRVESALEGDLSGRDRIYAGALYTWLNAEHFHNLIFGFGPEGTLNNIGIRAHNDWLEILVDYGLVGFVSYLVFFVALLKAVWRNKMDKQLFYALLAVFFIWFSKSLYSMGFSSYLFSYLSMAIGIVLGLEYRIKHGKTVQTI